MISRTLATPGMTYCLSNRKTDGETMMPRKTLLTAILTLTAFGAATPALAQAYRQSIPGSACHVSPVTGRTPLYQYINEKLMNRGSAFTEIFGVACPISEFQPGYKLEHWHVTVTNNFTEATPCWAVRGSGDQFWTAYFEPGRTSRQTAPRPFDISALASMTLHCALGPMSSIDQISLDWAPEK